MTGFVPISRLLLCDRQKDHAVARGAEGIERWGAFASAIGKLAYRVKSAGGSDWLIATEDAYALAVALLAVLQAGKRAHLPSNLQTGHLSELARPCDGVLVQRAGVLGEAREMVILDQEGDGGQWCFEALDAASCEIRLHTSGTTGKPEAVAKPLRCLEAEVAVLDEVFGASGAQSVLATVPAYHIYGLLFRVLWPLSAGRMFEADTVAFPEELTALAGQRPAPLLVSSPAFLRRALPILDLERMDRCLWGAFSSGGPLAPDVAAAYNATLRCNLVEVYGSTETGGIAHRSVVDAAAPPPWTPLPGVAVTLSRDEELITVESPFLTTMGPFETGDRGRILADGSFFLEGRKDRIVKLEERRVSLLEIEDRLKGCAEVDDVRVLALETAASRAAIGAAVVPSEQGWHLLEARGKRALRESLHNALKPHLEALALPRRWRFVRRLPETAQGKTTAASLAALFLPASGRVVEPEGAHRTVSGTRAEIGMELQRELVYFDGHFDAAAILPGVVQVDWAIKEARKCFPVPCTFHRIEALKFFSVLPAGTRVKLELEFDASKARLGFSYHSGEITHSSGRIKFEPSQ